MDTFLSCSAALQQVDATTLASFGDGAAFHELLATVKRLKQEHTRLLMANMPHATATLCAALSINDVLEEEGRPGEFVDQAIKYNNQTLIVGTYFTKQMRRGYKVVGCNEYGCGKCGRVTFVAAPTINGIFKKHARKPFGNAMLKTRHHCPQWRASSNYNPLEVPEELKELIEIDFANEVDQEKKRRGEKSFTFAEDTPLGIHIKFDLDEGLVKTIKVTGLVEGRQVSNIVEEGVLPMRCACMYSIYEKQSASSVLSPRFHVSPPSAGCATGADRRSQQGACCRPPNRRFDAEVQGPTNYAHPSNRTGERTVHHAHTGRKGPGWGRIPRLGSDRRTR